MVSIENVLIDSDNIISRPNNITLRKINAKLYGFDKMYIDKELIEDNLYQIMDQFNERRITTKKFYSIIF